MHMGYRHIASVVLTVTGLLIGSAGVAAADAPTRVFIGGPLAFAFDAGDVCAFPLGVNAVVNNEVLTSFTGGSFQITGAFKGELKNLTTGKTLLVNASGPAHVPADGGSFVVAGDQLFFFRAGLDTASQGTGVFLTHGRFTINRDANGNISSIPGTGFISDNFCKALT